MRTRLKVNNLRTLPVLFNVMFFLEFGTPLILALYTAPYFACIGGSKLFTSCTIKVIVGCLIFKILSTQSGLYLEQ